MKVKLFLLAAGCLLITSCVTTNKSGLLVPFAYTEIVPNEIRADIDFEESEKVVGHSTQTYLGTFRVSGSRSYFINSVAPTSLFGGFPNRIEKVKSSAMYDAMEKGDYDIIANPQYKIVLTTHLFGLIKTYDVKVIGYGARINRIYHSDDPQYDKKVLVTQEN